MTFLKGDKNIMKKTKQKDWIGSNILILSTILLIIIFIMEPKGLKINPNVFIGSLTALLGLLSTMIYIKSTKAMDAERRLHELDLNHHNTLAQIGMRSYDVRKEIYQQFLQPFMDTMILLKRGKEPDFQEQTESIMKSNIDIHLLGSDETCRTWQEWRSLSFKGKSEDIEIQKRRNAAILIFYARIILSIRRDLGQKDTKIDELGILRSFLTDIDEHKDEYREASLWKSASDVP